MISTIENDLESRMQKSVDALKLAFSKIRTGRAHSSLLDDIRVNYYGNETSLNQIANVSVEDARTLSIRLWEKNMVQEVEKAILKSNLGLNPSTAGEMIRIPLPALTEETRKGYTRKARQEAENARVSVRNIRREVLTDIKALEKEKKISEDDCHRAQEKTQNITDKFIIKIDKMLADKEKDLMAV